MLLKTKGKVALRCFLYAGRKIPRETFSGKEMNFSRLLQKPDIEIMS